MSFCNQLNSSCICPILKGKAVHEWLYNTAQWAQFISGARCGKSQGSIASLLHCGAHLMLLYRKCRRVRWHGKGPVAQLFD